METFTCPECGSECYDEDESPMDAATCSAVDMAEELREGFRGLRIHAATNGDKAAELTASAHHKLADDLVQKLGGQSVLQQNVNIQP